MTDRGQIYFGTGFAILRGGLQSQQLILISTDPKEMDMSHSIGTTPVEDVMTKVLVTVEPTDRMKEVAKILDEHDINAAPVVDEFGKCIGIVTSHDLVEFESTRREIDNELRHGEYYNLAKYEGVAKPGWPTNFDRVDFNMTRLLTTAEPWHPLSRIATAMCEKHIHHVLILDDDQQPIGMISALDILSHMTGAPLNLHSVKAKQ